MDVMSWQQVRRHALAREAHADRAVIDRRL